MDFVLIRPPPEFTLDDAAHRMHKSIVIYRDSFKQRIKVYNARASEALTRAQTPYKADFNKLLRTLTQVRTDQFVCLDMSEADNAKYKHTNKDAGPVKVLDVANVRASVC